jgi:glutamate synthase (NADPH/NADH) large chain/glutamate synthase (ferredoxin)
LAEAQQTLLLNNLRNRITLRTDGGIRNGRDVVIAAMLGAEQFNFGTTAMIAMGCVYVRKCHLNNCPVGVATTDPKFRAKFKGTPEMVIHYFDGVAKEARNIMAKLGVRTLDELIGRPEFLRQRKVTDHPKANTLDLKPILRDVIPVVAQSQGVPAESLSRIRTQERNDGIAKPALDLQILADIKKALGVEPDATVSTKAYGAPADVKLAEALALLPDRAPIELRYNVVNTDRNIGTRISGRVAEIYGDHGLAKNSISLTCYGTAGQSLGTFLVSGIRLKVIGEANDYVGKGMAGGEIVVMPPSDAKFTPSTNTIIGNTCLYGATGGQLFAYGRAGERFGVRNSGATAVIEGCGDHGCEYMTHGNIAILGKTGKNFGAGMSGGTAYIYDIDDRFYSRLNDEMVVALSVTRECDKSELRQLIENHHAKTGSARAASLLADWETSLKKFVRVIAKERAALEAAEKQHEAASSR